MINKKKYKKLLVIVSIATLLTITFPSICNASEKEISVPVETSTIIYRLYNPNSGEHFYTDKDAEKNFLVSIGWNDEGIGWVAPKTSKTPVYRLYNPNAGDHHYTLSKAERDWLVSVGWNYEGIGWYSDDAKTTPLYRQYNPNAKTGSHNFTCSQAENNHLVNCGWNAEGIAWYGVMPGGNVLIGEESGVTENGVVNGNRRYVLIH